MNRSRESAMQRPGNPRCDSTKHNSAYVVLQKNDEQSDGRLRGFLDIEILFRYYSNASACCATRLHVFSLDEEWMFLIVGQSLLPIYSRLSKTHP